MIYLLLGLVAVTAFLFSAVVIAAVVVLGIAVVRGTQATVAIVRELREAPRAPDARARERWSNSLRRYW